MLLYSFRLYYVQNSSTRIYFDCMFTNAYKSNQTYTIHNTEHVNNVIFFRTQKSNKPMQVVYITTCLCADLKP